MEKTSTNGRFIDTQDQVLIGELLVEMLEPWAPDLDTLEIEITESEVMADLSYGRETPATR
jgi:hypothetical protein